MTVPMAIVPIEPDEKMIHTAAQTLDYPSAFMGGPSRHNKQLAPKVHASLLSASPTSGRVSRAQRDAVACIISGAPFPSTKSRNKAEAAIAALGLSLEPGIQDEGGK